MRITILGNDGPLAKATRAAIEQRGHTAATDGECAVFCRGPAEILGEAIARGNYSRLVLRSHAYAYGSNPRNPGMMDEQRVSLLPAAAPERRWLELEEIAAAHPNHAIVRLTNVLASGEGDLLVSKLNSRFATTLAGRDPNVQFISAADAASVLVAACESRATGLFNASGEGAVPLRKALAAAGTTRAPIPGLLAAKSLDQLQHNWTVSSERAQRELGWRAIRSTAEALADFLQTKPGAHPERLGKPFDDWGLDADYIRAWGPWFWFLRNVYWRIDHEGLDNVPAAGRGIFVSNHRGFMPLDAVMHLSLILTHRGRIPRFLIIHTLLRLPFLCNFLTKLGGVVASQENAVRLFAAEELVGIFPEGIRGTFTPYKRTHRLRDFSRSEFAKMAIENQAPVIPAAVVGHAEIFPILGRIDSSLVTCELGWPYLPIAPMFPLAPVPLPSKWHVRVLPPVGFQGLRAEDAANARLVKEFSRHIQNLLQQNIDEMVKRRKHIFWGRVLNASGSPAGSPPLPAPQTGRSVQ